MKECCGPKIETTDVVSQAFVNVLWLALIINALMFFVEIGAGIKSGSSALTADAIDFLGDAINYGSSLFFVSKGQKARAWLSISKGLTMLVYALVVLGVAVFRAFYGNTPSYETMGLVGSLALIANAVVALFLFKFRNGDSNMQSVWICTRNDVIGNIAVLLAAGGVFATQTKYPDLAVAALMAIMGLQGAIQIIKVARSELKQVA